MKLFFKKSSLRQKVFFSTCGKAVPKTSMTWWNSWLEAVNTHNELFVHYDQLIKNLSDSNINSPLIKTLKELISNKNLRQQIRFLSTISVPIINAILLSQKQEILGTEINKNTQNLINLFRELYSDISQNNEIIVI